MDNPEQSYRTPAEILKSLEDGYEVTAQLATILGYNWRQLSRLPSGHRKEKQLISLLESNLFGYKNSYLRHMANVWGITGSTEAVWADISSLAQTRRRNLNRVLEAQSIRGRLLHCIGIQNPTDSLQPRIRSKHLGFTEKEHKTLWLARIQLPPAGWDDQAGRVMYATEHLLDDHLRTEFKVIGVEIQDPEPDSANFWHEISPIHAHLERSST